MAIWHLFLSITKGTQFIVTNSFFSDSIFFDLHIVSTTPSNYEYMDMDGIFKTMKNKKKKQSIYLSFEYTQCVSDTFFPCAHVFK